MRERTFRPAKAPVQVVRFTPGRRGRCSARARTEPYASRTSRARQLTSVLRGHAGRVWDASFNQSGDTIISSGQDGTVRRWTPPSVEVVRRPRPERQLQPGRITGPRWRDGRTHPDLARSRSPRREAPVVDPYPTYAQFSPDGGHVVTVTVQGNVNVFDLADDERGRAVRRPRRLGLRRRAGSRGAALVTGGADGRVVIRTLGGAAEPAVFDAKQGPLDHLAFSRGRHAIATSGADGSIKLWRTDKVGSPVSVLKGGPRNTCSTSIASGGVSSRPARTGRFGCGRLATRTAAVLRGHAATSRRRPSARTARGSSARGIDGRSACGLRDARVR